MAKKIAIISTVLILLTGIGLGGWFVYNELVRPEMAYANAKEIMAEVYTAEFNYTETADVIFNFDESLEVDLDPVQMDIEMKGVYDVDAEAIYADMAMDLGEDFGGEQNAKLWVEGDDVVIEMMGVQQEFSLSEVEEELLSIEDVQSEQVWSYIGNSEYVFEGKVDLDGVEAYRYVVELSEEDVSTYEDAVDTYLEEILATFEDIEMNDVVVEGFTYTVWVDVDDLTPLKEEVVIDSMSVEVPEYFEFVLENYVMTFEYESVNEEIEIPSL